MPTKKKPVRKNTKSVRLPSHVLPERYTLALKPDLQSCTFSGTETIHLSLLKETKEITLHSKDLDIENVHVHKGKQQIFASVSYDTKNETATFHFDKHIEKGKVKLSFTFHGIISDTLRGFYKSTYSINGETRHIATTQFEATDARRAFPCFDEPAQKAIFDVTLIIPGTHTAISNTLPVSIKEHEGGFKVVEFAPTPRMSTYLLAFIIGDFEYIEGRTKDDVLVRVFTTPGKIHQAKFALDVAIRSLEFYNHYFNIPYPLPTLDMIAIPDFESGAMENWGAVTYRETALLVDEEHSSLSTKQWAALVIAHELAHQWFGNLVTMEWWTDLWLNEGFASYIEYLAVDHIFPEWKIWDQFLTSDMAAALRLDGLAHSHPIEVTVHHPDEISEIFDMVSYAKGATVIRMLANYLGEKDFRDGLRHYLKKHSYKNTQTKDLWESFEKISKKPVKKMMMSWTKKTGYPLLTLSKSKNSYAISQSRFFSSRISANRDTEHTLWNVPIEYETNKGDKNLLLTGKSIKIPDTHIGKINKGESTLARVRYDIETTASLHQKITDGTLSAHDRLGIVRDAFALAEGGYILTTRALELATSCTHEKEFIVWAELSSGIHRILNLIDDKEAEKAFFSFGKSIFKELALDIGWEKKKGEHHSHTFLRNLALSNMALFGDTNVIKEALAKAKQGYSSLPADIRGVVYSIVAQKGNTKTWNDFKKRYIETSLQEEKDRYGRALANFTNKKLLAKTLAFALSKDVRGQDAPFMISLVWQNKYGRELTWQFVKNNWPLLVQRYGEGGHFLSRLLSPLGTHTTTKDAREIESFFKKNRAPGADRTIEQALERIYSNSAWKKSDEKDIKKWLSKNN